MLKVMLVDSDKHTLRTLSDELEKEYAVLACAEGRKALDLFRVFSPDAVVLDPLTQGLGPDNFISKMRGLPGKADTKAIVMSHSALIKEIEDSFDWGANYYFFKPVLAHRVHRKVQELLHKKASRVLPMRPEKDFPGQKTEYLTGI